MNRRTLQWLLALAVLGLLAVPMPATAHNNHQTATTVSCSPNPVVRGDSTTCTLRVNDIAASQNAQPIGTMRIYRGSFAPANLLGSCTAVGVPNQTASSCTLTYTPMTEGTETLVADFVNGATGADPHTWCSSTQTTGGCSGTTRGSTSLTVNPAPPASLRIVQSPSGQPTHTTAGVAIQRAGGGGVQVEVLNTLGERITTGTGSTLAVTMAIQNNAGGGTLSGTLTVNAVNGVATFSTMSINRAGIGYTLRATGSGVTGVTTAAFNITAAAASRFAFAQQPSTKVAGDVIGGATGVTARVEDQFGNLVNTDNATDITVAIDANPGGGTLGGTLTRTVVAGVATFDDLWIDRAGNGYTLAATGAYTTGVSIAFDIVPGDPARVSFLDQPTATMAGQVINGATGVTARIEDALGNLIPTSSAPVTVALAANPGSATLHGTLTVNALNGVATFDDLVVTTAASGYTLAASSPGLMGSTSDAFAITPSPAVRLAYGQPPTNNEAAVPITPPITVRIEDASGNLVDDARTVTIALDANPGAATLQGTLSVAAVNGIATFDDVVIDVAAAGYTLTATTTGGLTPVTSAPFSIAAGAPTQLAFEQQPTDVTAGALISPAVTVRILDTVGNLVTSATQAVTVSIASNPGGGALSGTVTVNAVNGVASFSTLSINRAGAGYTLAASAASLAGAVSADFDVTVGAATQLQVGQQPANTVAGQVISGPAGGVTVRVLDASGNLVTNSTAAVTMAIEFDAGGVSTALNGTTTVNAVNGIATFANLSINRTGTGYTLRASAASLAGATSAAFNITHAQAAKLAFGVQPANTTAGATITPAVTVRVLDQFDNLVTSSTASVALSIGNNPGGATLGGNAVANAVNGVASFNNLFINRSGNGYTLAASGSGLAGAGSNGFDITPGPAARLGFTVQPTHTPLLQSISPAVRVAVQDALGNTITTSSASVSLVIDNNPGGAELGGTITEAAVSGIATFSNVYLDRTGSGYTLQANSSGLASATSAAFNILVGDPAQLAFEQQPMNTAPNTVMTPWPSVRVQDAAGNPVPYSGAITVTLGNAGGTCNGTLAGTTTVNADNGLAVFDTLQVSTAGTGCTLVAASTGLTGATSSTFNVLNPGFTFTGLSPVNGPTGGGTVVRIYGSGFGPQTGRYQVIFGNANPAPPVTATRISDGELEVNTPAHPPGLVNVAVLDTTNGGTRALQDSFTYISQPPTRLGFVEQPSDVPAGDTFSPSVSVGVLDVNGNIVNNATTAITIAFHTNTAGGTLLGTKTVNAVAGVATFTDLAVDTVGAGYRLVATAAGLDPTPGSNAFAVTAGAPAKLAFSQQPTNNDPAVPISPAVTVEIQDEHGNRVLGSEDVVEMAIGINAGAGTLSGGVSVAAVDGLATFNSISIDKAGNGYTLVATSGTLTQAESSTFDIRFGAPARVVVDTHPGNGVAGAALTPAIVAHVVDNQGNVVTDYADPVTVTIHTNPGGAVLSGTLNAMPVDGVATFSDVRLDKVGLGYRLSLNSFGLESGVTGLFDITHAAAAALQFTAQPADVSQHSVITPAPEVRVVDAFGNHVPTATHAITMSFGTNAGGGTLGGTVMRSAVGGVTAFNDLTVSAAGDGYTLAANATGLTGAVSQPFNVIGSGGSLNMFSPCTGIDTTLHPDCPIEQGRVSNAVVGYLPTVVAGEDFCIDMVRVNAAGTGTENYNATVTLQMLDASVNTGSLLPGNCRSSWTVIKEWTGIVSTNADGGRIRICGLNEGDVWPQVRFRAFHTQGQAGVGCSTDAFAMRPDFFELDTILVSDDDWQTAGTARSLILPGAPTTSGGPVHAAGRPFRVQVTAINRQGQPTTNYDGKPRIEVLERLLPTTCDGCSAEPVVHSTGWGKSATVPGAVRTNQAVFHDAGALRIRIVDETFSSVDQVDVDLGLQDPDDGVIVSLPVDIGRFVPDNFAVLPTNTPEFYTQGNACAGDRSFTYLGQQFRYRTEPIATVIARSANGAVTPAYQGALWKLTPDKVLQEYSDNTVPADAADLDTSDAPFTPGNASLVSAGDGTGTLTVNRAQDRLSYTREPLPAVGGVVPEPPLPFDAFISLTLRVFDDSESGVTGNAQINTGAPGLFSNIAFDRGNEFRYGRLRLVNAVGSELEPLVMPYRLQTWQDVGNGIHAWVTESADNCTALEPAMFTIQNVQDTGAGGLSPAITGFDSPAAAGVGDVTFGPQAPAVTGSFELFGNDVPSWLQFNWTNDEGGAEEGPTGKGAFGVNEGNPRRIFRTQSFTPRAN